MINLRWIRVIFVCCGFQLLLACSIPTSVLRRDIETDSVALGQNYYRGRLALKVDQDHTEATGPPQGKSFSAGFELSGTAQRGNLVLLSPLGGIVAAMIWMPDKAQLSTNGAAQSFESLEALILHATGSNIPVASLFEWLAGNSSITSDWQADLSQFSSGRLTARKVSPGPKTELRIVLEL